MHGFVVINEGFTQHFVLNLFTEYFMHAEFASNMWWWQLLEYDRTDW